MGYTELIARAKELDKRATPGPWKWDLRKTCRDAKIVTDHSGQYYVMCFERWGMQGAVPSFQVYDKYEGPVTERGSHGMKRADALARSYPGKEHHVGFDDYPDHPDAKFIVESRKLVPELVAALENLAAERAQIAAQLDRIVKEFGLYHDGQQSAILNILAMLKEGRLVPVPAPGDVLYETDPEHGVVKHTVTDVHWVANTSAVDDNGKEWADYYTDEDIQTAHPNREAAEAAQAAGSIMEG